jgi:hypothetical protein
VIRADRVSARGWQRSSRTCDMVSEPTFSS